MLKIDLYSNLGYCISKCYHDISDIVAEDGLNPVLSDDVKKCQQEVRNNPEQVLFVLVYKDILISANDMTSLPSVVSHLLQDYGDVFQKKHRRD